jgi:hypothetical protein
VGDEPFLHFDTINSAVALFLHPRHTCYGQAPVDMHIACSIRLAPPQPSPGAATGANPYSAAFAPGLHHYDIVCCCTGLRLRLEGACQGHAPVGTPVDPHNTLLKCHAVAISCCVQLRFQAAGRT